jgi:hypothetical protein
LKPLQPSLMVVRIAKAYLIGEISEYVPLRVESCLWLLTNVRLGWKDFPESNALAYFHPKNIIVLQY